jgi:acetyl esterase
MSRRVRVFTRLVDRVLGVPVATMTAKDLVRARRPRAASGPVALFVGRTEPGVHVRTDTVAGDGGTRLDVTLYRPDGRPDPVASRGSAAGRRPLVVYFHGGGWVVGNAASAGWLCSGVAAGTGALVASVEYRMAPEHRFPTAALDCHAAVADLVAAAGRLGVDPGRVALMGDSAGGNLSAVVSLLARDGGGPAVAAQALVYPATDATLASPSIQRLRDAPILDLDDIHGYRRHYLGPDGDPTDARVSPLLAASHAGLPPTLVQTAEHDPLVDDGRRYADALAAAGVPVRYTCYAGMPHGFLSFAGVAGAAAHQARAEIVAFLEAAFDPGRAH